MASRATNSILVFEWLTGGGLWIDEEKFDCQSELFRQGWAMLNSVVQDLADGGFAVSLLLDQRCQQSPAAAHICEVASKQQLLTQLQSLAGDSTHILVIAPETGQILSRCCRWLAQWRSRCIFPDDGFVNLCSDKNALCRFLQTRHIAVADGWPLPEWIARDACHQQEFPAVLKPFDGCAGEGIRYISASNRMARPEYPELWRLEKFVAGVPASVSVIGGRQPIILPPLRQCFDAFPLGNFVGAEHDLTPEQSQLAMRLAADVVRVLPVTRGYYGIDIVITETQAIVIEVNPRLTVSYCKLREICDFSLTQAMVDSQAYLPQ